MNQLTTNLQPCPPTPSPGEILDLSACDDYLQEIESLHEEVHTAMFAIGANSWPSLETSLWRQEVLCVSLKRLVQSLQLTQLGANALARVQSVTLELSWLNRSYANLVSQANSSNELLYELCLSYNHTTQHNAFTNLGQTCCLEA